tara:strand:+ start:41239 stop:41511 length:273 start_codon:yes stop_codon:yes gene_type:complete
MQLADFSELAIKILLKCHDQKLNKRDITQRFKPYAIELRTNALNELFDANYITAKKLPRSNTTGPAPTYFSVTEDGETAIEEYFQQYPDN